MQKINNNKGITLTTLAITIVVLLIIVGITVTSGINGGNTAKDNQAITDLEKVQHAVAQRYSKFKLTNDTNLLVGTSVDLASITDVPDSINWKVCQFSDVSVENVRKYYRINSQNLKD